MEDVAANLNDGADGAGDRPQSGNRGSGAYTPRRFKVKGQEMVVESREKEEEAIQKGLAFERNQEALNEEKRKLRAQRQQELEDLQPLLEIDAKLRTDPTKMRKVNAILNDQPMPADELETDDPVLQLVNEQGRQIRSLTALVNRQVGGVAQGLDEVRRGKALDIEERALRRKYPKIADDERVDRAREHAVEHGLSLTTAFKDLVFDEAQDLAREQVFEDFDIDRSTMPGASEAPSIDGIGPVTPEGLSQLARTDPEKYMRFRPNIRAARRAMTGKIPLGG